MHLVSRKCSQLIEVLAARLSFVSVLHVRFTDDMRKVRFTQTQDDSRTMIHTTGDDSRNSLDVSRRATENARPDIARPSKLWGLTSQDWTTRHHIARVDIARLDNAAPD